MRADLLGLGPELLVRLANVGLVKRAQKELAAGAAPELVEEPEGDVVATARDGAVTRLPRGAALPQTTCTCGSSAVCRHRLAAVLAYQQLHAAPVVEAWDPGELDERGCGEPALLRADALQAGGVVATVRREGAIAPTVTLPMATVQFLVPRDLAYGKCDCMRGHLCEHVVLAIRACRAARAGEASTPAAAAVTVTLGGPSAVDTGAIAAALEHVARYGLAAPGTDARLAQARAGAERAHWWWVAEGLEELERLGEAYAQQSARFTLARLAREAGELVARLRAAAAVDGPLAPAWVLGSDQAGETQLEQTRLLALGARVFADGERRAVRIYFADPNTANVLVLDKTWPKEARVGHELGALYGSSKLTVADLARGELVTRGAKRTANGTLDLGAARGMKASLLPTSGSWELLAPPLLVTDLAAHRAQHEALPPACLRPRGRGASVVVVALRRVVAIEASADGQSVTARVEDLAGGTLVLHVEHRAVSPGAVDATIAALRAGPSHVAGELVHGADAAAGAGGAHDGVAMAPIGFLTDRLVAIELAAPALRRAAAGATTPRIGDAPDAGDVALAASREPAAARALRDYLGRAWLGGVRATASTARSVAREMERSGAARIAALLGRAADGDPTALLDLAALQQLAAP